MHFVLGALTFGLKCLFFSPSRIIGHPQLRKWALKIERGGGGGTIFPQKKRGQNERVVVGGRTRQKGEGRQII